MNPRNFFSELKRRNVYKVAVAYAVVAWLLMQVATQIFPFFEIPNWAVRLVVLLLILGFPVALILAWAFEITPEGIKRAEDVGPNESITRKTGRKLVGITIALAVLAAGLFSFRLLQPKVTEVPLTNSATTASAIAEKSIAVLPFENLSEEKSNAYFVDGIQDEILTRLAKISALKVISRTSTRRYASRPDNLREIAKQLGVASILEGSVQRVGGAVRVNVQLIDASKDRHLWAETYDRDIKDIFAVESEIAQSVADALKAQLLPAESARVANVPTKNPLAYDMYLRAKESQQNSTGFTAESNKEQIGLLEQAVTLDPAFVPALCLMAKIHLQTYWFNYDHTAARLEQAKRAVAAAARLQPDAGEVHLARALLYYWGNRDYAPALAELSLARRALPNDGDVVYFTAAIERRQGQWKESTRHFEEALKLDPHNAGTLLELSITCMYDKRYSEAARVLDDGLGWKPNDFIFESTRAEVDRRSSADLRRYESALFGAAAAAAADPDTVAQARLSLAFNQRDFAAAQKALADYKAPDFAYVGVITPREVYEGLIARGVGDLAKAQSAFLAARERAAATLAKRPDDAKALIVLAQIDAYLGRKEEAIREGEQAAELLPVTKDALDGPYILTLLAGIYAQVGQPDRALDVLVRVKPMPRGPTYGDLTLDLDWDPLRGDPRFEKIVASLAPKERAK